MQSLTEDLYSIITKLYPLAGRDVAEELVLFASGGIKQQDANDFYYKIKAEHLSGKAFLLVKDCPFIIDSLLILAKNLGLVIEQIMHFAVLANRDEELNLISLEAFNPSEVSTRTETIVFIKYNQTDEFCNLELAIENAIKPLTLAVNDWFVMQQELLSLAESTVKQQDSIKTKDSYKTPSEVASFVKWLLDGGFVFLGVAFYDTTKQGSSAPLGIYKASDCYLNFNKDVSLKPDDFDLLEITESHHKSNIHKDSFFDIVRLQKFDQGKLTGEYRIYGLFTTKAYKQDVFTMPLIKKWISGILEDTGFLPHSYNWKEFVSFANSIPRETLFDLSSSELKNWGCSYVANKKLGKNSVFVRKDKSGRFYEITLACLIDINEDIQKKITDLIATKFKTSVEAEVFNASEINHPLIKLTADINHLNTNLSSDEIRALKQDILILSSDWNLELKREILKANSSLLCLSDDIVKHGTFSKNYKYNNLPSFAFKDLLLIKTLSPSNPFATRLRQKSGEADAFFVDIFALGKQLTLDYIVPILCSFGLKVISSKTFDYSVKNLSNCVSIKCILVKIEKIDLANFNNINENFCKLLTLIMNDKFEDGVLNALTITPAISIRHLTVLRAVIKYLHQARFTYSKKIIGEALVANPNFTKVLIGYFTTKFDPEFKGDRKTSMQQLEAELESLTSSTGDETRSSVLSGVLKVFKAIVRTNFYLNKDELSFKIKSTLIPFLPKPVPFAEIFVYSNDFEAVHLRGGKVARGGIRWSDRHEDFRTEVLGLVKAQTVKNAVIVPVGSKGGFIVKADQSKMSRDEYLAFGKACYQKFISSCLDITDNFAGGKVVKPAMVVDHDGEDPYFVVAADKGTATFSDAANAISEKYNFWLGDAFASGGSNGYDHKKMGITAKGAWVAAKRHFMELGINPEETEFTCVAIGDLSGDVFGNGMLRSKKMKLVAAFNHLHIFIDPNPNPQQSYEERLRMFNLPRSSWTDYDKTKISKGGAIFARSEAELSLSPEIKFLFGINQDKISPNELIKIILKHNADLLWNGGIGTYVKSSSETQEDAGDKANDLVRINGGELRCKIVAEGGNLGFTQLGRIEAARTGVMLNTDAMDNSAGVDCSDHEVNIKILLNNLVRSSRLSHEDRNTLLAEMTDEVDKLVLSDNYHQTQAISIMQGLNINPELYGDVISFLASEKLLDRENEFMPSQETIAKYKSSGLNLTRPELCVLFGYSKMYVYSLLHHCELIKDASLNCYIESYFPHQMSERFKNDVINHQLKAEIVATCITNEFINRLGITKAFGLKNSTYSDMPSIVKAFIAVKQAMQIDKIWTELESFDAKLNWQQALALHSCIINATQNSIIDLLKNCDIKKPLSNLTDDYKNYITNVKKDTKQSLQEVNIDGNPLARQLKTLPLLQALIGVNFA